MANTQEFLTIIKLNDTEAVNTLDRLRKKVNDLTAARDKAIASGTDSNFVKDLTKDLKKAQTELKSYDTNVRKTIETLDNLTSSSLKEIKQAMRAIRSEMDKTTNPEDYKRLEGLLDKCKERIDVFKTGIKGASAETENLAKVMQHLNSASLNQLNQAKAYLEEQMKGMNPQSTSYSTTIAQLQEVKARISQIDAEQTKLVSTIDKYDTEIENAKTDMANVRRETKLVSETLGNISGSSIRDLEYSLKIVEERLKGMSRGTTEFESMTAQAKRLRTELASIRTEGSAQQSWMGKMADGFNKWQAAAMTAVATLTGLTLTVRKCVDDYAKMEDTLASTRKYTGLSDRAVRDLNEDFKKMDTRTSRQQLNDFAGAAGRLGIQSKEAIEEFVDGADKVSVALGDDLGEGAVDTIGKLAMAFGEDKKMGLRGAMLATGSALNEIAQNSSANAGYVVDFTARLAGMGIQAKLSQQNIMGFASVLDQNMQEAEMSATALGQLITKMFQDPGKFAKLAGQDVKSFTTLLKTDANAALMQFFKAMHDKGGFTQLAPMFDKMGLSGNRCVGVLSTMASKLDDVKTAQNLANTAYSQGTSVINEFNIMNETENAKLDKAKKSFAELSISLGQKLLPIARYGITSGATFVKVLNALINFTSKYKITLTTLAIAIGVLTIVEMKDVAIKKLQVLWNNYLVAGCKKLWTVLASNPYVAIVAAGAMFIAFLIDLTKKTDSATEAQKKLNDIKKTAAEQSVDEKQKLSTLVSVARDEHQSMQDRITATNELNRIIPGYNAKLDKTTGKYIENKKALDDYLSSLVKKYELEGAKDQLAELGKKKAAATIELQGAQKNLKGAQNGGPGNTYTTSWGTVGNTSQDAVVKFKNDVNKAKTKVQDIVTQENVILDAYGNDLKHAAVQQIKKDQVIHNGSNGDNEDTGETDKERIAREKKEKAAEVARNKAAAAALKAKKEADKAEQAETNKELANNAIMYAQGLEDYRTFIENKESIQLKGIKNRQNIYDKNSDEYKNLLDDEVSITSKHDDLMLELQEKDVEKRHEQISAKLKSSFYDNNSDIYMNEDALNEALYQNDISAMQERLSLLKAGNEDWLNLKDEIEQKESDHQLDNEQKFQEKLQRYREQFGRIDVKETEEITLKGLDTLHDKGLLKEKEYEEMKKQIHLQYALESSEENKNNSNNEVTSKNAHTAYQTASNDADASEGDKKQTLGSFLIGDITHYKDTLSNLKDMYAQDAMSYEEYQKAKKEAFGNFVAGIVSKMQAAIDAITPMMSAMSSYYSAQSEYEQQVTTKKYDKLISAAGNNTNKTKKLEEKKQKELAKIKSKYNKKQMKIEIAQAYASTALAAINAYASAAKESWILGAIAAAMATATGMIQVATIKKQHAAEEEGYYTGGFTKGKQYRKIAGVVHEGEFVADHNTVNNTRILPALQLLDQAQKNNTVGSLTASDVSRSLGQGGTSVVSPVVNVQNNNDELNATMDAARDVISRLTVILSTPIKANVSIDGQDGVAHQLNRYNQLNNNK